MPPDLNNQNQFTSHRVVNLKKPPVYIVALIIFAALLGAFQIADMYLRKNTQPSLEQNLVATDPTADWKTYRNEELGFEFKYPPQYQAYIDQDKIQIIRPEDRISEGPSNNLLIEIKDNKDNLDIKEWWRQYGAYTTEAAKRIGLSPDTFPIKDVRVENTMGIYIGGSEGVITNYLIIPLNKKVFEILVMLPEIDQIISTFKFISTSTSQIDKSDWKVVGGDATGFKILVPPSSTVDLVPNPLTQPHGNLLVKNAYFDLTISTQSDFILDKSWKEEIINIGGRDYTALVNRGEGYNVMFISIDNLYISGMGKGDRGLELLIEVIKTFQQINY